MNIETIYKEYFDLQKSPRTRVNYEWVLNGFSDFIKKDPIAATKQDLNAYIIFLKQKGTKDSTIGTYMASIRSFYKWLVLNEKLAVDPSIVFATMRIKSTPPNPKPLNEEQRAILFKNLYWETLKDWQMSLTTLFGMEVGLRRFEICKIKWAEIDLETGRIKGIGKGDKSFDLNIPPNLLDKLKEYRRLCTEQAQIGTFVFFSEEGPNKPLNYSRPWDWAEALKKRCGFPKEVKLTPHVGRHTFVSHIVASGKATPEEGMEMSRHSDYSTYKRYMKLNEQKLKKLSSDIFH